MEAESLTLTTTPFDQSKDELVFLPLGGCGEIGMNLNAYGYGPANARRWIVVDVGVTFGNSETPGIDLICADPDFLVGEQIDAVFLTHAHEDHIGAVGLLYPLLRTKAPPPRPSSSIVPLARSR